MNAVKYALAVAVMALSATVSAQVVFVPDFPVKKPADTQTATADAPAAACPPSGLFESKGKGRRHPSASRPSPSGATRP